MLEFVPSVAWKWCDLTDLKLSFKRQQKQQHWTHSVPALPPPPCIFPHPAWYPAVQLARLKFICQGREGETEYKILLNLLSFSHPAEIQDDEFSNEKCSVLLERTKTQAT